MITDPALRRNVLVRSRLALRTAIALLLGCASVCSGDDAISLEKESLHKSTSVLVGSADCDKHPLFTYSPRERFKSEDDGDVVLLSPIVVTSGYERLTSKRVESIPQAALAKYYGTDDTLGGVLNKYTIARMWKKIPVLGRFNWHDDPERTAVDRFYMEKVRKVMLGITDVNGNEERPIWLNPKNDQ